MRNLRFVRAAICTMALVFMLFAGTSPAHHAFAMFEMTKTVEIAGTVRKFEWSNPHCWLFVAVTGADGADVTYGFEMSSVGELLRKGWTKSIVKPGDKIQVKFAPVRDGRPAGLLMSASNGDGTIIGQAIRSSLPVDGGQRPAESNDTGPSKPDERNGASAR